MTRTSLVWVLTATAALSCSTTDRGNPSWKAGAASTVITPSGPIWLAGYASRKHASEGKVHDLKAKALAIEDPAGNRALVITADLLGVTRELTARICERLRAKLGLPRHAIMIATSHTHTAPVLKGHLQPMYVLRKAERERISTYTGFVEDQMVRVASQAFEKLGPATFSWGIGRCNFAVNRRNNSEAQVLELRERGALKGPVDHDVPVLRVSGSGDTLRAIVFGYACHCTVLDSYKVSGDYAGFAQAALEKRHPGTVAMFFAGCGGDQNPLPRRQLHLASRYGEQLADAVSTMLETPLHPVQGRIKTIHGTVDLPFEKIPTPQDLESQSKDKNAYVRQRARWLQAIRREQGSLAPSYPYPVQAWRLGNAKHPLLWIALGGEVVVDYALRLKKELIPGKTWVAAYCNDVMGYIPSQRVWEEGGYEGGGSMVYYGLPSRWATNIETAVVNKVLELARNIGLPDKNP